MGKNGEKKRKPGRPPGSEGKIQATTSYICRVLDLDEGARQAVQEIVGIFHGRQSQAKAVAVKFVIEVIEKTHPGVFGGGKSKNAGEHSLDTGEDDRRFRELLDGLVAGQAETGEGSDSPVENGELALVPDTELQDKDEGEEISKA